MLKTLSRLGHAVSELPRRFLAAAGWANQEPTGLGVGAAHTVDPDELEAERRHERETWRRPEGKEPPADSN